MVRGEKGERRQVRLLWVLLASSVFAVAGLGLVAGDLRQIGGPWPHVALAVAGVALGLTVVGAALLLYAAKPLARRLEDDNEKLRATIESAVDAIVGIDDAGRIESFNSAAEEMFGYRREEVIGDNVNVLMPEPYHGEHDGYIRRYLETAEARIIGTGRTVKALRSDGTTFPIDLAVSEARVHGRRFFTGIVRDVTQRRGAEEALRRFERIVAATPDLISLVDRDYRYLLVNESYLRTFLKSRDEILGRTTADLIGSETFEQTIKPHLDRALAGEVVYYESWLDMGPQGRQYRGMTYYPYRDADGAVTGVVASVRDLTERREAEEEKAELQTQLHHAQKLEVLGTLSGGIAHDFNNVLTAIFVCAELTLEDLEPGSRARGQIENLLEAAERARELIRQILTFSRQAEHKRQPVRIQKVLEDALKLLRASLASSVEIHEHVEPECGPVLGDPTQIHQVVMNLCTNAAQAMAGTGGILEVRLEEVDPQPPAGSPQPPAGSPQPPPRFDVRLSVRDTGHGMDRATMDRVFEPFFSTKGARGSGLGLSVVHGIVTSHGGSITVDSEPGKGTTFRVDLPGVDAEVVAEEVWHRPIRGGHERILYVDDEELLSVVVERMLARIGYDVTVRAGGAEALELFRRQPDAFDLVMTDQTMPGMTGTRLARELSAIRPGIPILLMTGLGRLGLAEDEPAIRECLAKPFTYQELSEAVRRLLDPPPDDS